MSATDPSLRRFITPRAAAKHHNTALDAGIEPRLFTSRMIVTYPSISHSHCVSFLSFSIDQAPSDAR